MNKDDLYVNIHRPRSLMEDITNSLRDAIIEGRLHPGEQIVEKKLQETLGVSRAPIREALMKLEGQGLVVIVPRKGSFVRHITPQFIQESFTIRASLEGLAARLSLDYWKESDSTQLEQILNDMAYLAENKNFKGYFDRHWDFHNAFIIKSQNELLIEQIEVLRRRSLWLSYSVTYFEQNHEKTQKIHAQLIDIFRNGNPNEVEKKIRSHILSATGNYVKHLEKVNDIN